MKTTTFSIYLTEALMNKRSWFFSPNEYHNIIADHIHNGQPMTFIIKGTPHQIILPKSLESDFREKHKSLWNQEIPVAQGNIKTVKLNQLDKSQFTGRTSSGTRIPSGIEWETLIAVAFNGGPDKDRINNTTVARRLWDQWGDTAFQFANKIKQTLRGHFLVQYGSARAPLSKEWIQWGGTDQTPKSDILLDKKIGISIKKSGTSQFMSGMAGETIATFRAAMAYIGDSNKSDLNKIINQIRESFKDIYLDHQIKYYKNLPATATTKEQERAQKLAVLSKAHKTAAEVLRKFFTSQPKFKQAFLFEAATGETKFGPTSEAVAEYLFKFNPKTKQSQLSFIGKHGKLGKDLVPLANKIRIYVTFKSANSGPGKRYSVLRLQTQESTETSQPQTKTLNNIIGEEISNLNKRILLLQESNILLTEGLLLNFIKKSWNKIATKITQAAKSILALGRAAFEGLMNFFGIDINSVHVTMPTI